MLRFTATVEGIPQLDRAFNRVSETVSDLREVWPEVNRAFEEIERAQFASGGATGESGKWPPLSRVYAKWKAVNYPAGFQAGPMHRTFRLQKSLTGQTGDSIIAMQPKEFTRGTKVPYAAEHQRRKGRRPARPTISLSEQNKTALTKAIQRGLIEIVRRQSGFEVRS